jgi:hypothetical protein
MAKLINLLNPQYNYAPKRKKGPQMRKKRFVSNDVGIEYIYIVPFQYTFCWERFEYKFESISDIVHADIFRLKQRKRVGKEKNKGK